MSYTLDPLTLIVTVNPSSFIDDIFTANPDILIFHFPDGNYYLTDILKVTVPNISFIGTSGNPKNVHIFQNNTLRDGLAINANNFNMQYISIHDSHDGKIALTVAGSSNNTVQNCYFYGNKTTFTIFYAGPKNLLEGVSTLNAYSSNNLDMNNVFKNNVVYSQWSGDCVSFSLQVNGIFNNNIIRGGKLAIYMCKKSNFTNNIIYDSINSGIHVSFPSHNLNIVSNKIYECDASGIKLSNQVEHGTFTTTPYNITIRNNYIYDAKVNAIELNDANKCTIRTNKFISSETYGIYALRCTNLTINNNKISYFQVAFWLEATTYCNLFQNTCMSVYPDEGQNVVKTTPDSNNNIVYDNNVYGKIIYDKYALSAGNSEYNNAYYEYYDIGEEANIMK